MKTLFRKFALTLTNLFFAFFYKVELCNIENVPAKGPVLLYANHVGELDMFLIGYRLKRWVYWMAKKELFRIPIIGTIISWLGAFPIKRGSRDIKSIRKVYEHLEKGHIVGIFPEGTRTRGIRDPKRIAKPGIASLAINTGAPILPVAIKGNYKLFGKIKVVFGKPFSLDIDRSKKYNKEELTEISNSILDRIYSLLEE